MTNLSEIEKALRALHGLDPEWNKLCGRAADAIRELQRQVQENEQDARRYRWIKEQNGQLVPRDICLTFNTGHDWLRLDALDKRIDAALNTETTG